MGRTADSMMPWLSAVSGEDPAQVRGKALQARSGILDVRHAEGAGGFGLFKRLLVGVEPRRFHQLADVAHDRTGAYPVGSRAPAMILFGESIIFSFSYS